MLFYWMIWIKLGWDDARTFSVREIDLWILLSISIFLYPIYAVNLFYYAMISLFLVMLVLKEMIGSADRDVLLIILITRSFHTWCMILMLASVLALVHALFTKKNKVPFLFFLSLGHLLIFLLDVM